MKKTLALFTLYLLALVLFPNNTNANNVLPNETLQAIEEFNNDFSYDSALKVYQVQANDFVLNNINNNIETLKNEIINEIEIAKQNNQTSIVYALESYLNELNNYNSNFADDYAALDNQVMNEYDIANQLQESLNNIITGIDTNNNQNQ